MADVVVGRGRVEILLNGKEFLDELRNMQRAADERFASIQNGAKALIGVFAGFKVAGFLSGIVADGIRFNAAMQDSKLALTAIIQTTAKLAENGKEITDFGQKWGASLQLAQEAQDQLRIAGLKTALTYEELIQNFQIALPMAMQAGAKSMGEIVQLTSNVSQALRVMGIPMIQFRNEWNSLVTGHIDNRSDLARILFSGEPVANIRKQIAEWKKHGVVLDELNKKLEPFRKAGEEAAQNFTTAMSNATDAAHNFMGKALEPVSKELGGWINKLTGMLMSIDKAGNIIWNPDLLNPARAFVQVIADTVKATVEWVKTNSELIANVASALAIVGTFAAGLGVLALAFMAVTTPAGAAIASTIALAVAWEEARKFHGIEIGGVELGKWFKIAWAAVSTAFEGGVAVAKSQLNFLWETAKLVFTSIATAMMLMPKALAEIALYFKDYLPAGMVKLAEGVDDFTGNVIKAWAPLDNIKGAIGGVGTAVGTNIDLAEGFKKKVDEIMAGSSELPGPFDAVKSILAKIQPELDKLTKGMKDIKILPQPKPIDPGAQARIDDIARRTQHENNLRQSIIESMKVDAMRSPILKAQLKLDQLDAQAKRELAEAMEKINAEEKKDLASQNPSGADYGALRKATEKRMAAETEKKRVDLRRDITQAEIDIQLDKDKFDSEMALRSMKRVASTMDYEKAQITERYRLEREKIENETDVDSPERAERMRQIEAEMTGDLIDYDEKWFSKWYAGIRKMGQEATTLAQDLTAFATQTAQKMEDSWASGLFDALSGNIDKAREEFKSFMKGLLQEVVKFMVHRAVIQFLTAWGNRGASGAGPGGIPLASATAAKGAVWPGGFTPFAAGGIVNRPTLGLVGEGWNLEAIIPMPDNKHVPVELRQAASPPVNVALRFTPDFAQQFKSSPDEIEFVINSSMIRNGEVRKTFRSRGR